MNLYNPPPQGSYPQRNNAGRGPPQQGQDYFKFENVSPEMINFGLNAGQNIIQHQKEKWLPGMSTFWLSLKYYFSVSNQYVLKKLSVVLYPFGNKVWSRVQADEFERDGEVRLTATAGATTATTGVGIFSSHASSSDAEMSLAAEAIAEGEAYSRKWASPKQDFNAPDLYIPLMAFMTYVLLYGLGRGLVSTATDFSPDIIIQAIWHCLLLQCIEAALIKFGVNMLSVNVLFLDVFAYSGYKYVGLCINTIAKVLGGTVHFLVTIFTAVTLAYFILKTLAAVVPPNTNTGPPRHLLLLGFAAMQFVIIFILSWL